MSNLAVLDPHAVFVDVGRERMHVSIAGGQPAVFGTVTSQLHALRDYLAEHQVRSVARGATGVYWAAALGGRKLRAWKWSWSTVARHAIFRGGRPR